MFSQCLLYTSSRNTWVLPCSCLRRISQPISACKSKILIFKPLSGGDRRFLMLMTDFPFRQLLFQSVHNDNHGIGVQSAVLKQMIANCLVIGLIVILIEIPPLDDGVHTLMDVEILISQVFIKQRQQCFQDVYKRQFIYCSSINKIWLNT